MHHAWFEHVRTLCHVVCFFKHKNCKTVKTGWFIPTVLKRESFTPPLLWMFCLIHFLSFTHTYTVRLWMSDEYVSVCHALLFLNSFCYTLTLSLSSCSSITMFYSIYSRLNATWLHMIGIHNQCETLTKRTVMVPWYSEGMLLCYIVIITIFKYQGTMEQKKTL